MNQRDEKQNLLIKHNFLRLVGAVAGGTIAYAITSSLTRLDSALVCALAIACSSFASTRRSKPILWWAYLGAIAGGIIGTGSVLANSIAQSNLASEVADRCTIVGFLSISGLISGICLGKNLNKAHIPAPREFLKGARALTTGVFAVVVTIKFIFAGISVNALKQTQYLNNYSGCIPLCTWLAWVSNQSLPLSLKIEIFRYAYRRLLS